MKEKELPLGYRRYHGTLGFHKQVYSVRHLIYCSIEVEFRKEENSGGREGANVMAWRAPIVFVSARRTSY